MSSAEFLTNIIVSAIYTMLIALTPYIICKFVRKNISTKFAKKFTIIFSIVSFLIFLVIGFITNSKVTVYPAIVWNVLGYLIISPLKGKNTTPADFSNEPLSEIEKPTSLTNEKSDTNNDTKIENTLEEKSIASQNKSKNSNKKSNVITIATISILSIALISVSAFSIYQYNEIKSIKSQLDNLSIDYKTAQETIVNLKESNEENNVENLKNKLIASFYTEYAVCVGEDNYYYHSDPYCDYFDSQNFYIYNVENAEVQGYKPCPYCCN